MTITLALATGLVTGLALAPGVADPAHAAPTCHGRAATIVGTAGDDQITGTDQPDVIVTRGGDDHVTARGGRDVICLGGGADVADGGAGNDFVRAGAGPDYVAGTVDRDRVLGNRGRDVLFVTSPAGTDADGGRGDDAVTVNLSPTRARVSVVGGPGWNQIGFSVGGSGLDVEVDQAAGTVHIGGRPGTFSGFDYVSLSGDQQWTYGGTDAPESVTALEGALTAQLLGGADQVWTGDGDDWLDGGDGHDSSLGVGGGTNVCISIEVVDSGVCSPPGD
ncbi:hypothetical protein [Nocardioides antri]|uniref:Calcium-binding protein n=1 Tax=Nocardioides antri TaxID=2607659 RepID=A0A5B1M315_9ACTN|nr:hypothetical protein [Nocardioides antri]KAA1427164.1 hypothetical protein F0U47_06535 [Nocardioides antri]